jgi:hypothetical protein
LSLVKCYDAKLDRMPRRQCNLPVKIRCGELLVHLVSEDPVLGVTFRIKWIEKASSGRDANSQAVPPGNPWSLVTCELRAPTLWSDGEGRRHLWERTERSAEGLSGVVGTAWEGSCAGERGMR